MTPYQAAISPTTTRSQCCAVAPTTSARTPAQSHTVASKAPTIRTVRGDSLRGGILAMPNARMSRAPQLRGSSGRQEPRLHSDVSGHVFERKSYRRNAYPETLPCLLAVELRPQVGKAAQPFQGDDVAHLLAVEHCGRKPQD